MLGVGAAAAWLALRVVTTLRIGVLLGVALLSASALIRPSIRRWIPERACQVPGSLVQRHRMSHVAYLWGFQLGLGIRTFLVTPAFYGMLAVAVGQRHVCESILICVVYGLARGMAIAVVAVRRRPRGAFSELDLLVGLERKLRIPLVVVLVLAVLSMLM